MRDRFRSVERLAVRWGDMDSLGHVNNAKYFTYFECARFRWFEDVGVWRLRRGGQEGQEGPILASTSCEFRRQLKYPAAIDVGARATRLGNSSVTVEYAITEADSDPFGTLYAEGSSVVVWLDYATGKSSPWPDELRASIENWDGL